MIDKVQTSAAAIDAALRDAGPEAAAALALASRAGWAGDSRLAYAAGKALLRGGEAVLAAEAFGLAAEAEPAREPWWSWYASAILSAGAPRAHADRLIAAAGRYPDAGELQLAAARVAQAAAHPDAERLARRAVALRPGDAAAQRHFGRLALASGDLAAGVAALTIACADKPDTTSLVQLGEALLQLDRVADAADVYTRLVGLRPDDRHWQLVAANVVERAGRPAEALYARARELYRQAVPETLQSGLAALHATDDPAAVPRARIERAWALRSPAYAGSRTEWERAARWGARVESLIVDWMVGASDRSQELRALTRVTNPEMLEAARAGGRGVLLAGSHLGPLLAVPAALVDSAMPFEWIGSSGGWDDTPVSRSLISPLRLSARDVGWRLFAGLRNGHAILYAVDGDGSPTTPTRDLAGLAVPQVSFAPEMVWSAKATSLFIAAHWESGRIAISFAPMPTPQDAANSADFAAAWGDAYYAHVRALLASAPENLRLRGGIWSRIR